jgi:hypothetical protein
MVRTIWLCVGVLLFAQYAASASDYLTGNDMQPICSKLASGELGKTLDEAAYRGQCEGMVETLIVLGSHLQSNMRFCVPGEVTIQQGLKVFVSFLNANPSLLHRPADVLAIEAFRAAWPCPAAN